MSGRDVMVREEPSRRGGTANGSKRSIIGALLIAALGMSTPPATSFMEVPIAPLRSPPAGEGIDRAEAGDDLPPSPEAIAEARAALRCAHTPFFWCTGGIGQEERAALVAMAEFTLCVEWAERSRPFLAAGTLTVASEAGEELLTLTDAGPWWCAALPPGRYRLIASAQPLVEYPPQQRLVLLKREGRREWVHFLW